MRSRGEWRGRQIYRRDQLVLAQVGIDVRSACRQPVKLCDWYFALALGPLHPHDRIKGGKGHVHIARVGRDALVALPQDCVDSVISVKRATAASRVPLIALWKRGIVKIITP